MRCKSCCRLLSTCMHIPWFSYRQEIELKLLQGIQHLPVVQYFLLRQEGEQTLPAQIPESKNTNRSYGVSILRWNHEHIFLALHFPLWQSAAVCCLRWLPSTAPVGKQRPRQGPPGDGRVYSSLSRILPLAPS